MGNGAGRTAWPPSPRVNEGGRDVGTGRIGPRARWSRVRGMEPEKCTFPKMTLASATGLCPWPALLGTGGGLGGCWGRIPTSLSDLSRFRSPPALCPRIIQAGHRKLPQHERLGQECCLYNFHIYICVYIYMTMCIVHIYTYIPNI